MSTMPAALLQPVAFTAASTLSLDRAQFRRNLRSSRHGAVIGLRHHPPRIGAARIVTGF